MSRLLLTRTLTLSLSLALATLPLVCASPWDQLVGATVRYASLPCTCTAASRLTNTPFTSQEGFDFTFSSTLTGDCTAPVTTFVLTAQQQQLTRAIFYVQYEGRCSTTQDCSQPRCDAIATGGASTVSCSFTRPQDYASTMYVYILWQTTESAQNRQYPLPSPAFIRLTADCASTPSYTSTCQNGQCACGTGEIGSMCPAVPTSAPTVAATAPVPTSAPVVGNPSTMTPAPVQATPTPTPTPASTGPRLIFSDEFDRLDCSVWEHELTLAGDGNWCFQQYTNNRTNTFVRDGKLFIKPTMTADLIGEDAVTGKTPYTLDLGSLEPTMRCTGDAFNGCRRTSDPAHYLNPAQSAAIRTAHSFSFKYGRMEIRAKLPRGDWLWPAIWLLPKWTSYGQWPMSGEIDIMESRGNAPGYVGAGSDTFGSTLHWGPYFPQDIYEKTHQSYTLPAGESFANSFHTFGLYWDATGLYTYLDADANRVLQVNWTKTSFYELGEFEKIGASNPWTGAGAGVGAPFDQEFYLILDVAVGGAAPGMRGLPSYFPETPDRPWRNDEYAMKNFYDNRQQWLPTWKGDDVAMQVDWVRVWQ